MGMATALAAARLAIVYSINIHSTTYVKTPDQPQAMPRRTKQEAQQTRHALLDAAELVFERRGVAGTSLQEVAAAAGLTRGAVYWHFRDKADLFNAMMDRAVLPFEQHWLQPAADPLARLRDVLVDILRQVAKGMSFAEIGGILTISQHTVVAHVKKIYRKLAVHSRGEAVFEASQMGLL